MKKLQIFKTGSHTSTDGQTTDFGEDHLAASAKAYDPAKHEAPLTIGHPKDNLPAYGWVSGLEYAEGALEAAPHQVENQFAEMVNAGRFKKISASFYTPDSPANPVPGVYYLRHVAFLGAQPPAVKGMRDASFADNEEGVIAFEEKADFSDGWMARVLGRLFKGLREHIIDREDTDTADRVLPGYLIEDLENMAREADSEMAVNPAFNEPANEGDNAMTDIDIKKAELEKKEADLKAREDQIAAKEAEYAEREKQAREREFAEFADKAIADNKATPAERGVIIATMRALSAAEGEVEFGEGQAAEKLAALDAYKRSIDARKPAVDFGERSGATAGGGESEDADANDLAEKAREYRETKKAKGVIVSTAQAVAAVRAGKAA